MNFFNLFKLKDSNTDMVSDTQFIALPTGTTIRKSTGEEYIKTDTNVFDKTTKTVRTDAENDLRYPQIDKANVFNYPNVFNRGITVSGNIKSDNIENTADISTRNLTASDKIKGSTLEIDDDSNLNDVYCSNLTASDKLKGASLEVSGDSELTNVDVSGYVKAQGTIASEGLLQGNNLSIANNADLTNIHSKTIVNDTSLKTDSLEVENDTVLNNVDLVDANIQNNLSVAELLTAKNISSVNITNSAKIKTASFESTANASVGGNLTVNGESAMNGMSATSIADSGALTVDGIATFKDNTVSKNITNSNNITTQTLTVSNNSVIANQAPTVNNSGTIGTSALYYKTAYITTIYGTDYKGKAYKAGYADLAEVYTTDKPYEAGTVLQVCTSSNVQGEEYFGGALLGVVSTNAGIILNEESEGCVVALKGMIPVKCEGNIEKGQYCIAHNGKVVGMFRHQMTVDNLLRLVGVALEDSKDGMVLVKV